ncbi:uncharacterized protein BDZ99DRAFT_469280 [Mytilinidion resinicola]|uniref:Uncharacterized protein n=1 Tax=Mytilinidion resinicola TaxID=574789 RepID=A0A6A6Y024_9PEZI|nr:uncharacterized protein BDZ99DRAFT_469280 [Mytilinidion resinicola]KAF2801999.1 hypothetical protein BDZ99DRAFT_469280 [Mytilinidion resinicola]
MARTKGTYPSIYPQTHALHHLAPIPPAFPLSAGPGAERSGPRRLHVPAPFSQLGKSRLRSPAFRLCC